MLAPYTQKFGREKILVLTFEELKSNPKALLNQIATFLSISPSFDLTSGYQHRTEVKSNLERLLLLRYQSIIHMFPASYRSYAKTFLRMFSSQQKLVPSDIQLEEIHSHIQTDVLRFIEKYGINMNDWKTFESLEKRTQKGRIYP